MVTQTLGSDDPVDSWLSPIAEMEVMMKIIVSTSLYLINHTKEKQDFMFIHSRRQFSKLKHLKYGRAKSPWQNLEPDRCLENVLQGRNPIWGLRSLGCLSYLMSPAYISLHEHNLTPSSPCPSVSGHSVGNM